MSQILLLNPSRRKRRKKSASRKRRSPAQRAATRKLLAFNRARRAGKSVKRRRRKNRSVKSFNPFSGVKTMARRKRRTTSRRYRRNPISGRSITSSLRGYSPAVSGAVGALALNGILNNAPIPAQLMAGKMAYVTKAALAVLIGYVGNKVSFTRPYARNMALGALTVTLADLGKELAAGAGVNLSGVGYINPGWIASPRAPGGRTVPGALGRIGQYVPNNVRQMPKLAQYVRR
jgi:hypothetical protein